MLNVSKAFSSFSVNDIQKAKEFYGKTLAFITVHSNERHAFGAQCVSVRLVAERDSCASTGKNRKNRLRCPVSLFPSRLAGHPTGTRVHDDDERKPNAKCSQPTARRKWAGNSSPHDRRNVCVGLLRKSRKGSL